MAKYEPPKFEFAQTFSNTSRLRSSSLSASKRVQRQEGLSLCLRLFSRQLSDHVHRHSSKLPCTVRAYIRDLSSISPTMPGFPSWLDWQWSWKQHGHTQHSWPRERALSNSGVGWVFSCFGEYLNVFLKGPHVWILTTCFPDQRTCRPPRTEPLRWTLGLTCAWVILILQLVCLFPFFKKLLVLTWTWQTR